MAQVNSRSFFWLLVALAASVMLSIVLRLMPALPPVNHAEARHGASVVMSITQQCLGGDRPTMKFYNPTTRRTGTVCKMDDGKFGIVITEADGSPVTQFVKDKMRDAAQVIKYMKNAGYEVIQ